MTSPLITSSDSIEIAAQAHLDILAKPPGALGRLEELAVRLCGASGSPAPETRPRALVIFCADHGSVASGVSLWPQAVTRAVVSTLLAGGGAAAVMARAADVKFGVMDVGMVGAPLSASPALETRRVQPGSADMAHEPALSREAFMEAIDIGRDRASCEIAGGARLLVAGEVGIGNTTAAAAITALLCGHPVNKVIGAGAGASVETFAAKQRVVAAALERAAQIGDPVTRIASVAGLEIAAMAGFYLEASSRNVPVVLDGAISGAAALIAQALDPAAPRAMIASHLSPEPGHALALVRLNLSAFLDWRMRLGEGTGALALLPQIDIAAALMREMATLQQALALVPE